MKLFRPLFALAVVGLLAACVSGPARPPVPVDYAQAQEQDRLRAEVRDWRLAGRVAVSNGSQGGSGRIEWRQQDGRYEISLGAPVTRQSWRLAGDASGARLEGLEGGPRESPHVERMLLTATGWEIPVRAMVAWALGIGATDEITAPARIEYGEGNLPATLEQIGWRIDYRDWYPATDGLPALPRRIEAQRGSARVRLIVDRWEPAAP